MSAPVTTITIAGTVTAITGEPSVGEVFLSANGTPAVELILGHAGDGTPVTVKTSSLTWLGADLPWASRDAEKRLLAARFNHDSEAAA